MSLQFLAAFLQGRASMSFLDGCAQGIKVSAQGHPSQPSQRSIVFIQKRKQKATTSADMLLEDYICSIVWIWEVVKKKKKKKTGSEPQ